MQNNMKSKEKKLGLGQAMYLKIIPAIFLVGYYWMLARSDYKESYSIIHNIIFGLIGVYAVIMMTYKKEKFDEFALENLKTTDSKCMKITTLLLIIGALVSVISRFSGVIVGYYLVGSVLFITILRAIIFNKIDKEGM